MKILRRIFVVAASTLSFVPTFGGPLTSYLSEKPIESYDLTWINGQSRQRHYPLEFKEANGNNILTAGAYVDCYYNYNFNNPVDNTHTVSSSIGRANEFTVNMASMGFESYYKNVIGRIWLQYGQMASIVQELDGSVAHGRNTSISNLKFIREATAGYQFNIKNKYYLNAEAGIFLSYMGMESYMLNDNWCYQRNMACEFTPFYLSGARFQFLRSATPVKFKQEIWMINGWQSYNSWNQGLALGSASCWRPNTDLQLIANFYLAGQDTRNSPGTYRFHHDHSMVARYYSHKENRGITQAALSINNHYGFQTGNGITPSVNYIIGTSVANRLWFGKNKYALTLRAEYLKNPGAYLAFSPSPVVANDFNDALAAGKVLGIAQATATFDIMPNDYCTFRLEYGYRSSSIPYFAGRGGTTSPDGWVDTPLGTWRPDLVTQEGRFTAAINFRL